MAEKIETTVKKITEKLFEHLETKAEVEVTKDKEGLVKVQLKTEEPGILIGYHGQTLASIQLLIAMMVYRKVGEWTRILVDVDGYRERRKEALQRLALSAARKAEFSGEEQSLPPMNAAERRIIHLALADRPEVETESEGEGRERRVIVKPKSSKK